MKTRPCFALAALLTACGMQGGTFGADGFHHSRYAYDVRYADASKERVMPDSWRLDNYVVKGSSVSQKRNGFYETTFEFDTDADERLDAVDTVPAFDLRFEHRRTGAIVWLRTIPAPTYQTKTALYVLTRDYIAGISGTGYELAQFGHQVGANEKKQFAIQILEMKPARLAELEALAVTIEVADLNELKISAQAKRKRVKLVLVQAALTHRLPASDKEFPSVLVAGYANTPDFFDKNLADFQNFLGRIVLNEKSGYKESAPRP